MSRWLRVRWRWFRLEFNRRAHDRVYYEEPTAYIIQRGDPCYTAYIMAHPLLAAALRTEQARLATKPHLFGDGLRVLETSCCVKRTWRWARR